MTYLYQEMNLLMISKRSQHSIIYILIELNKQARGMIV